MSGVRRKTKYRKGVEEDVLHSLPEPKEGESIVRVVAPRGGNLVEVEAVDGVKALCRLPNRYRKVVWVKRGTLLIVETCAETYSTAAGEEGKVKYAVNHVIFTEDQIKHLRKNGLLPVAFDLKAEDLTAEKAPGEDDMLQANRNRRPALDEDSSSGDDSSDEEGAGKQAVVGEEVSAEDESSSEEDDD
jgi:probable RNA-binding protein EIF1AD